MNLLYLANLEDCPCGGQQYISAIYIEISAIEPHIMIEEHCLSCDQLDITDIPMSKVQAIIDALETIGDPNDPPEDDERGEEIIDELGMVSGHRPARKHEDL